MDLILKFVLVGAWLYCMLRVEKLAHDLKKMEIFGVHGPMGPPGPMGLTGRDGRDAPGALERPEVDRPGIERLGFKPDTPPTETFLGDGDTCPECKEGTLVVREVDGCTCFISPPCNACVTNPLTCDNCGHQEHP